MKRKLKSIFEFILTAAERIFYALCAALFLKAGSYLFSTISSTTGWAVVGYFFLGLLTCVFGLGSVLLLGFATPIKFEKKKKQTTAPKQDIPF